MSEASQPVSRVRLSSIDAMRGFVMVLMAIDHASMFYNAHRVASDTAAAYNPGDGLPAVQFLVRWITHLCAPTFLFLAGTALALSAARRTRMGLSEWQFDRDLVIRGTLIAALEVVLLGGLSGTPLFSVLYAIGLSMILMVPLRRLPPWVLLVATLAWFIGSEWVTSFFWRGAGDASIAAALLVARHYGTQIHIIYPLLHWLPIMVLGWVFGHHLKDAKQPPIRLLLVSAGLSLLVFTVVRYLGGYGNMFLLPDDNSIVQWLHVSKYPPSLTFLTLELGIMALCLAGFMWLEPRMKPRPNGLLAVLGQTALFFYILHFMTLGAAKVVFGLKAGPLSGAIAAAAGTLILLYPACRWFRTYKRAHPDAWVRFI